MSAVLMCDAGCGELFSVNEVGWKQFEESIDYRQNNPHNHGMRVMHMCKNCIPATGTQPVRPIARMIES
jgi:hypothetical protein